MEDMFKIQNVVHVESGKQLEKNGKHYNVGSIEMNISFENVQLR